MVVVDERYWVDRARGEEWEWSADLRGLRAGGLAAWGVPSLHPPLASFALLRMLRRGLVSKEGNPEMESGAGLRQSRTPPLRVAEL
jgi:hypothetical protein